MALRLRRGTDAERLLITPLQGELIYTTDTKKIYVGDGAGVGGVLVGPADVVDFEILNDASPQLGGDLDLNGNSITGVGNINIDGTITATGNIGLGDNAADEITVGGVINSDLRPALDNTFSLGSGLRRWKELNVSGVNVDQTISAQSLVVGGSIYGADSTLVYNAITDTLAASTIVGNVTGSVFSDDSSAVLVDGVAGQITGPVNNTSVTTNSLVLPGPLSGITIITEGTLEDDYTLFSIESYQSTANPNGATYIRGRGTEAAPAIVQAGDSIFHNYFLGLTNTNPGVAAIIEVNTDANGTISDGVTPGSISLKTFNDAGTEVLGLGLNRNGEITVANNTLIAGTNPGEVDDSAAVTYLKVVVGSTEYAMPLFGIRV